MLVLFLIVVTIPQQLRAQVQEREPKQVESATKRAQAPQENSYNNQVASVTEAKLKEADSNFDFLSFLTLPFPVLTVSGNEELENKLPEFFAEAVNTAKKCNQYNLEDINPDNAKELFLKLAENENQGSYYISSECARLIENSNPNKLELIKALQIKLENVTAIHSKYYFPLPLPSEKLEKSKFEESAIQYKKNLLKYLYFYPFMGEFTVSILKNEKFAAPTELIKQLSLLTKNNTNQ